MSYALRILFSEIIIFKKLPEKMKMSQITPVLKAGKNKNMISSYRPIAVQDNNMRVFEKLIFIQLNPLLQKMIPPNQ